jgi:hypothetical protein
VNLKGVLYMDLFVFRDNHFVLSKIESVSEITVSGGYAEFVIVTDSGKEHRLFSCIYTDTAYSDSPYFDNGVTLDMLKEGRKDLLEALMKFES